MAGKRLGPAEIESILAQHEAVAEAAAVVIPHQIKGEAILCFVVTRPGYPVGESLRSELCTRVTAALGKSFADPGDLSTIESLAAIEAIRLSE